jgi:acyl-CoA thioesterase FadM
MSDCAIVYKSEGFFNQKLICEVGGSDFSRVAFDLYYRFVHVDAETGERGKILAEAKTGMVCFDYSVKKVKSIPHRLRARLGDTSLPETATTQTEIR